MSDVRIIVDHLNASPFFKKLTLVDFDEKNHFELLNLLNEVFITMDDKHNVDLREETDEIRTYRMMEFLKLLKYPIAKEDEFRNGLSRGERQVIYPIFYWALSNLKVHTKRAYLGRYLAPLQVPQEFLFDAALNNLNDHYKELQQDFKHVHKQYDSNAQNGNQSVHLRKEITQLEEEKLQLKEKISNLKRKMNKEDGFKELLNCTSALRKEQEEQHKILERKHDQSIGIAIAEKRYRETYQHMNEMKESTSGTVTAEHLFETLHHRVEHHRYILSSVLPVDLQHKKQVLGALENELRAPKKTEEDLNDLEDEVTRMKASIDNFNQQIESATRASGDDKMVIFRQHANAQSKKVIEKQEELEQLQREKVELKRQADALENQVAEISGPKYMKRDDLKKYAAQLRIKTQEFKKRKGEMAALNAETVTLNRTEQVLKGRLTNVEGFMKSLEENKGVSLSSRDRLEHVSSEAITKGQTLEEIGRIVTSINLHIQERKTKLAPEIAVLRALRTEYQEFEQEYVERKSVYDNTAIGMETDRIKLEQECNAFQDDTIKEESRYHALQMQCSIEDARMVRIEQEADYERGKGRLLRDFKTFQDLYHHKITTQEGLSKELRKQQKNLKENSVETSSQRAGFEELLQLLQCKAASLRGPEEDDVSGKASELHMAQYDAMNYGGANVMTIDS